jgi:hypothetical protein
MATLGMTLVSGEDDEAEISNREAGLIKAGFAKGEVFTFLDDEGVWVWFNPDHFANVWIED